MANSISARVEKPPAYRWFVLIMCGLSGVTAVGIAWMSMPVLFSEISVKLDLSFPQLMTIWGIVPLAVLLSSIPSGILGDRFGIRLVCGIGILLCGIVGALRGIATNFTTLALFMFLYGIFQPLAFVNFIKALGMWFPPREMGMASGVLNSFIGAGGAIGMMISSTVLSPALGGWNRVLYLYGAIAIVIGILWLLFIRDRKVTVPEKPDTVTTERSSLRADYLKMLRSKNVWFLILIYLMFMGGYLGASGSLPYLLKAQGWSANQADLVISLVLWLFVLGSMIVPTISDRIGLRRIVFTVCLIPAGLAIFGCFFLPSPWIWGAAAIWGLCAGAIPLVMAVPLELPEVGPALAGSAMGLIMAAGNVGGFIFPLVTAPLAAINPLWVGVLCGIIGFSGTALVIWGVVETGEKARKNR